MTSEEKKHILDKAKNIKFWVKQSPYHPSPYSEEQKHILEKTENIKESFPSPPLPDIKSDIDVLECLYCHKKIGYQAYRAGGRPVICCVFCLPKLKDEVNP